MWCHVFHQSSGWERERETEAGKSRNEERWKIKRGPQEGKALACGTVSVCALAWLSHEPSADSFWTSYESNEALEVSSADQTEWFYTSNKLCLSRSSCRFARINIFLKSVHFLPMKHKLLALKLLIFLFKRKFFFFSFFFPVRYFTSFNNTRQRFYSKHFFYECFQNDLTRKKWKWEMKHFTCLVMGKFVMRKFESDDY